ncbi:MAG: polysaccharide deacetylase family protein [Candidatus Omnitrophica bacterium]|jgi:peptidoglycan/xylan/chitin deacetylase (PgdA/CDA1 family)|nr:polysaccharide deacetylase family protein [Candidatus Omnitrophota bacterium]
MKFKRWVSWGIFFILAASFYLYLNLNYRTPIFMYHTLCKSESGDNTAVEISVFKKQMEFLKKGGYKVISLNQYCRLLAEGESLPRHTVVITFDDGHDNTLEAAKILRDYDYPATFFLISNFLNKDDFLSTDDIYFFLKSTKIEIGSHTLFHAYLPSLNSSQIKKEIFESKKNLEKKFGQKVNTISYPVGGFNKEVLEIVKDAGYLCACTTNRGFSRALDRFALRRVKITNKDLGFHFWRKASGFYQIFERTKDPF